MKLKIDKKHKYVNLPLMLFIRSGQNVIFYARNGDTGFLPQIFGAVLRCVRLVKELFEFKIKLKKEEDDHLESIKNTVKLMLC